MDRYVAHYEGQIGRGGHVSGIDRIYIGSTNQRGHGIGSFLGGLFRQALPLIKSGSRALGREALSAGARIITDVIEDDKPFRESVKQRTLESRDNLKKRALNKISSMMSGSGYKTSRSRATAQLRAALRAKRLIAKKWKATRKTVKRPAKKRKLEDIFS